jgi:hypothetical protein
MSGTRLDEYDKEEWWDVARRLNADITREEYEQQWAEFVALKKGKELQ